MTIDHVTTDQPVASNNLGDLLRSRKVIVLAGPGGVG